MPKSRDEMGIQEYQDSTFLINDAPDRRLTDEQIAADWSARFPTRTARVFAGSLKERLSQVQGIRRLYNQRQANEHGKRDDFGRVVGPPDNISLPYDEDGEKYAYSAVWLEASLAGRKPDQVGVPPGVRLRGGQSLARIAARREQPWTSADLSTLASSYIEDLLLLRGSAIPSDSSRLAPLFARYGAPGIAAARQRITDALDSVGFPIAGQLRSAPSPEPEVVGVLEQLLLANPVLMTDLLDEATPKAEPPPFERPAATYFEAAPSSPPAGSPAFRSHAVAREWSEIHEKNTRLGSSGEQWVVELERCRLTEGGRSDLADRVEWTSRVQGDGLGYDVASYELDGSQRLIEVKTTSVNSRNRSFFVTANEVRCSELLSANYCLYRVYGFPASPSVYVLAGPLTKTCRLAPTTYAAWPELAPVIE